MSKASRSKGKRGELDFCQYARDHGHPDAKRTSDGRTQNQRGDVAGIPGAYIEVRRRETINIWACLDEAIEQAPPGDTPIVAFRRNNSEWMAALPLKALLALLADRDSGRLSA